MKVIYLNRRINDTPKFRRIIGNFSPRYIGPTSEAFFCGSLHTAFDVTETSINDVLGKRKNDYIDNEIIIVTVKAVDKSNYSSYLFKDIAQNYKNKIKVLSVFNDQASNMPPDSILNYYDYVVKYMPYKDRDRYKISNINKEKIIPTILGFGGIYKNIFSGSYKIRKLKFNNANYKNDVFFSGKATNVSREKYISAIKNNKIKFYGGLQDSKFIKIKSSNYFPRLKKYSFLEIINESKINLTINGIDDGFSFRHLDIFSSGGFCLCHSSIKELDLLIDFKENKHFSCFNNKIDLIEKINYYLKNDDLREKIALEANIKFKSEYNFKKHGSWLNKRFTS